MRIAGFAKLRNEILKEGDLTRVLACLDAMCDGGVVADDASSDGTREHLRAWVATRPSWTLLEVAPAEQAFEKEIAVKQRMLERLGELGHGLAGSGEQGRGEAYFSWVLWLDGDESIDATPDEVRAYLASLPDDVPGVRCRYVQLWRNASWARTDQGFADGSFCKFWKVPGAWRAETGMGLACQGLVGQGKAGLSFAVEGGTHKQQFPQQIEYARCPEAPFTVTHWGNYGKNIVWKAVQYSAGRGGVDRHIAFGHAPEESLATGQGFDVASWSAPYPTYRRVGQGADPQPVPFTIGEIRRVRSFGSMRALPGWFTVVLPTYNRAATLGKALESLLFQSWEQWVCVVLDDGSTDETPALMRSWQDRDPRIFYARYSENRGGVAMNEIGMALACEWTEWWTRLGSDDWWGPGKLARDAEALRQHEACYGPYYDSADGQFLGKKNPERSPEEITTAHLRGLFVVSWANVAARTSVLRRVRERFGAFTDPRLRNCEDFLFNARVTAVGADWHWRPDNGELDAIWTVSPAEAASAPDHCHVLAADEQLTRQLIAEMGRG